MVLIEGVDDGGRGAVEAVIEVYGEYVAAAVGLELYCLEFGVGRNPVLEQRAVDEDAEVSCARKGEDDGAVAVGGEGDGVVRHPVAVVDGPRPGDGSYPSRVAAEGVFVEEVPIGRGFCGVRHGHHCLYSS